MAINNHNKSLEYINSVSPSLALDQDATPGSKQDNIMNNHVRELPCPGWRS